MATIMDSGNMCISTFFILSNHFIVQEYNLWFKFYAYKGGKRPFFPRIKCHQMEIQIFIDLQSSNVIASYLSDA